MKGCLPFSQEEQQMLAVSSSGPVDWILRQSRWIAALIMCRREAAVDMADKGSPFLLRMAAIPECSQDGNPELSPAVGDDFFCLAVNGQARQRSCLEPCECSRLSSIVLQLHHRTFGSLMDVLMIRGVPLLLLEVASLSLSTYHYCAGVRVLWEGVTCPLSWSGGCGVRFSWDRTTPPRERGGAIKPRWTPNMPGLCSEHKKGSRSNSEHVSIKIPQHYLSHGQFCLAHVRVGDADCWSMLGICRGRLSWHLPNRIVQWLRVGRMLLTPWNWQK